MFKGKDNKSEDKSGDKSTRVGSAAFHVVKMLAGIPKDLVALFTPNNDDELVQLEMNIVKWVARMRERTKVMQLQKRHGLPLRPNQSLRDVTIRVKILELKKNRKFGDNGDFLGKDDSNV